MPGEHDQILQYADAGPLPAKLAPGAALKSYPGFPHGMPAIHAGQIHADLPALIKD